MIKKARRRNVGDDSGAPKNAFSSFGGFAGAKPSAEASFSFLGGDKKSEAAPMFGSAATKPSFAFGSSSSGADAAKPATFGAFSFGAKAEEKKAEPVKVSPLSPLNDNKAWVTYSCFIIINSVLRIRIMEQFHFLPSGSLS